MKTLKKKAKKKKPYDNLSDLEKVQAQWWKLSGLHSRSEWSSAVIRAATAAELAANFAVRSEYALRSKLEPEVVDRFLYLANGLNGKIHKVLIPLAILDRERKVALKKLAKTADELNELRNSIAHQGKFCSKAKATSAIGHAREFVESLVRIYEPSFKLREKMAPPT